MSGFAPEVGPDGRPRPKFGEYATPEEQRARIRQPDAGTALSAGHAPDASSSPPPVPRPAAGLGNRGVDRILTWGLLGYGLFTVITTIPALIDYGAFAEAFLKAIGSDATLADPAAGRGWGIGAALVLGLGWLAAAFLSWRGMRAGWVTFWIPLVAGCICQLVSSMLLFVPLYADPAVRAAIQTFVFGGPVGS